VELLKGESMELLKYQREAHKTAIYPEKKLLLSAGQIYVLMGLGGESGELQNLCKKALRGDFGKKPGENPEFLEKLNTELGGVLWYLAEVCNVFNLSLRVVAEQNLAKLKERKKSGTLMGEGDDR
jgi:NTP pyrophosphatase (non-canonical NTP hydrolase)